MPSHDHLAELRAECAPWLDALAQHALYGRIKTVRHLRVFMEHHVWAVWDFMCLLSALRQVLSCSEVPWLPTGNARARRLINEIALAEESDVTGESTMSHFELYIEAMREVGADVRPIEVFQRELRAKHHLGCLGYNKQKLVIECMVEAGAPAAAQFFVAKTMSACERDPHRVGAYFTIGREQAIPVMFRALVGELLGTKGIEMPRLLYYLDRHVALDGGEHGPKAEEMLEYLCGHDVVRWSDATNSASLALSARASLWTAIAEVLA